MNSPELERFANPSSPMPIEVIGCLDEISRFRDGLYVPLLPEGLVTFNIEYDPSTRHDRLGGTSPDVSSIGETTKRLAYSAVTYDSKPDDNKMVPLIINCSVNGAQGRKEFLIIDSPVGTLFNADRSKITHVDDGYLLRALITLDSAATASSAEDL